MEQKMFCFQCEQTAGCSGCTGNAGVCGKSANTAKYSDKKATKNGQKYVYKVVTYYNGNQTVSSAYSAAKTGYRLSTMKVSSLTNKKGKKAYIKWTKNSKSTGYQIKYVTGKSKAKTVKASSKAKTKSISILI